jgi:hypothetical protein
MNSDKAMTMIVRGAGVVCWLLAGWQLFDMLGLLWERRNSLGSVGGYGSALLTLGLLAVAGTVLWIFAERLGCWLGKEPTRRKPRPTSSPKSFPAPHEDDA